MPHDCMVAPLQFICCNVQLLVTNGSTNVYVHCSLFTVHLRWWNLWNTTSILIGQGDRLSFFHAFLLLLFEGFVAICKVYRWWHAAIVSMPVTTNSIIIQLLFIILHPRWIFLANADQIWPHQTYYLLQFNKIFNLWMKILYVNI